MTKLNSINDSIRKKGLKSLTSFHCFTEYRKKWCMLLISFFIFSSISFVPQYQFAQTSYELVCRGGGNLYFNYTPFSNLFNEPQIWITFERASQSVGSQWENLHILNPGQCSWTGRPVHNTEPNRILIKIRANEFSIAWSQGKVMGISSGLIYINNLLDANRYQSFFVYNDGRGNFIVTSIGQSK